MSERRTIVYYVLHDGEGNYLRYAQLDRQPYTITTTRSQQAAWFTLDQQEAYAKSWKAKMYVMALVAYE